MKFTKMHGLGNDYLYVYCEEVPADIEQLAIKYSDRHFGAGADGIICILPSADADFKMRIFNADGSEAMMCGNGIRCVGKYVYDRGYTNKTDLAIETLSGIKQLHLTVESNSSNNNCVTLVTVDMGRAIVSPQQETNVSCGFFFDEVIGAFCASRNEEEPVPYFAVDMGNPHAVIFVSDAENAPVEEVGHALEKSSAFENGVNVEFVQVISKNEIRMRVWERGSGITMACGTGSCASVAAAIAAHLCHRDTPVTVHLDGGDLIISVDYENNVSMTGPATFVYDGTTIE